MRDLLGNLKGLQQGIASPGMIVHATYLGGIRVISKSWANCGGKGEQITNDIQASGLEGAGQLPTKIITVVESGIKEITPPLINIWILPKKSQK